MRGRSSGCAKDSWPVVVNRTLARTTRRGRRAQSCGHVGETLRDEMDGRASPPTRGRHTYFCAPPDRPGLVLDDTLRAAERTPESLVDEFANVFLAVVLPGLAGASGQGVVRAPLPHELAHGDVIGHKPRSVKRVFAREAAWAVPPPNGC